MRHRIRLVLLCLLLVAMQAAGSLRAGEPEDFFESRIRPILVGTCFRCHGGDKTSGGLRVDSRQALVTGGDSGPAIVPQQPDESLLIKAIQRQAQVAAMPPDKESALRADQVVDFVAWIEAGAAWPETSPKFQNAVLWSWQPIRDPAPPAVRDQAWLQTSIDPFIRARQEAAGVQPSAPADKWTLIRRVTFDLTGLPPTREEVEAFESDTSQQAYETLIDRLLQSPAYGERWARHWLDVVRYADTAGETADYPVPLAWRYRNYVIDAFNADKPYDEFLREQIAGDVLAAQGPRDLYAERTTATGYLAISRRFGFDSENYHHLTIQDTIDTLGQSVLGLSLGCARCHDHKFDAVTMRDYYGLYGIFDSSRYAFPGSEQKQKVRSLVPLLPVHESVPKWRDFEAKVNSLASQLAKQNRPVPAAVLRSLNDLDGDFELQAPAAGGSNGVLVSPWLYEGRIAVTTAAQSPFKNVYPSGRIGASIDAASGTYRIAQAIHPRRTSNDCQRVYVNLDFRVAAPQAATPGEHRFWLGSLESGPACELLITSESMALRTGETTEVVARLQSNQWHNVQLALDLRSRTISGKVGTPAAMTEFTDKPAAATWSGVLDFVTLDSLGPQAVALPAVEYDNFGVQETPLAAVSTEPRALPVAANQPDPIELSKELQTLTGIDGDFELQTKDAPPAAPWNPGPNSVVQLAAASQSPFGNVYEPGELGMHMPNRGEYDGFGLTFAPLQPNAEGRLSVGFDFCCANQDAGGDGSWRYYLGHGPGNSAAIELFMNGREFFRRSADSREPVCSIAVGEWYQVQLTLDVPARTYSGSIASPAGTTEFSGQFASNWDGTFDYSFIDSYGHLGGVRPALHADNFIFSPTALPALEARAVAADAASRAARRARVAEIRTQLGTLAGSADELQRELGLLLAEGPFAMAYGMAEGTPHNVSIQLRGEPDQPGEQVPRGFIQALGGSPLPQQTTSSGRLELAQWLTSEDNPLTARVMANRVWQYHFGRGLVKTPNDFGVRGLPPTHPDLLDHLASRFIQGGWSIKSLHRLILLSATYQQTSAATQDASRAATEVDTSDLHARFPRRRLSAEEIRDAILAVSGELDRSRAQEHPFPTPIGWGYSQHGPFSAVYDHNRRGIFLMTQRLKRHPFLALFDGADPNATTAERLGTTVPTQALFFLNDPFVHAKADKWATRLAAENPDAESRVVRAWLSACARMPSVLERREALDFLTAYEAELKLLGQDQPAHRALAAYLRTLFAGNEFLHLD